MKDIILKPIGTIHTPFQSLTDMPIQPKGGEGVKGSIEIFDEYVDGLLDIEGFSHIILLFHFHKSEGFNLQAKPFLEDVEHGVFAIRAPKRPNPIGMSIVKLLSRNDNILEIEDLDVVDGTPLLDIKPYIPDFDNIKEVRTGWIEKHSGKVDKHRSDGRFNDR